MYERFTDRARKVMQLANQESQYFNHEYIGTEHILLGLVKEGSGVAANVLHNLDVDLRKVRREVEKLVQRGPEWVTMGKLPHTPRAKKVIEYAMEEARDLGHNYVGTEHLLLGLLRVEEGVAAQVLINLGVKLDVVRAAVLDLLGQGGGGDWSRQWPWGRASTVSWVPGHAISNFSERAREVLEQAEKHARELDHGNVSTAHLLLSLVGAAETAAGAVLRESGLKAEELRRALLSPLVEFPPWPANGNPDYTARLCAALETAMQQARQRSPRHELLARLDELREQKEQALAAQDFETAARLHDEAMQIKKQLPERAGSVQPAHLLLGLLHEPHGVAVRIIQELGLHPEQVRAEVLRRLAEQNV